MTLRCGLIAVSDRATAGVYEDRGTPAMRVYLTRVITTPIEFVERLIPDEAAAISAAIIELADQEGCCLILTTGGTGPAPRDVTPEATEAVLDRVIPGFGELMRRISHAIIPTAILSRQLAGTRGSSLIINLPGNPKAIAECLDAVMPAVPDCIDLINGPRIDLLDSVGAWRPPQS
jgi:molybdopterin adenylyltransferase